MVRVEIFLESVGAAFWTKHIDVTVPGRSDFTFAISTLVVEQFVQGTYDLFISPETRVELVPALSAGADRIAIKPFCLLERVVRPF